MFGIRKYVGLLTVFGVAILLFGGCSRQNPEGNMEPGKVLPSIHCLDDSAHVYSLYLPGQYSSRDNWPVIYWFDPQANGLGAVEKYHSLAETFGFILVGSNISRNGMAPGTSLDHYKKIRKDVESRLAISRTYTAGFSGGARVAANCALQDAGVTGVIGCGAGFPGRVSGQKLLFRFIGLVGLKDFNFPELQNLDTQLEPVMADHFVMTFDGKHEWPPLKVMKEAFKWIVLKDMKDKLVPKDQDKIARWLKEDLDRIVHHHELVPERARQYEKIIHFYKGLIKTDDYVTELNKVKTKPGYVRHQAKLKRLYTSEIQMSRSLTKAFQSNSLDQWKAEMEKINEKIDQSPDDDHINSLHRTKGYLSMIAYMHASRFLTDPVQAGHYVSLYAIIDPENPEPAVLAAKLLARRGKPKEAANKLKEAFQLDFDDMARLEQDPDLSPVIAGPEFSNWLKEEGMMNTE